MLHRFDIHTYVIFFCWVYLIFNSAILRRITGTLKCYTGILAVISGSQSHKILISSIVERKDTGECLHIIIYVQLNIVNICECVALSHFLITWVYWIHHHHPFYSLKSICRKWRRSICHIELLSSPGQFTSRLSNVYGECKLIDAVHMHLRCGARVGCWTSHGTLEGRINQS